MAALLAVIGTAQANFDIDVDDDGKTEALTDGLLVITKSLDEVVWILWCIIDSF